ncbi:MAG TPA: hypothetical protein VGZ93_01550 [Candidatus Methylacidiphilales bacterium]|jgi:predicted nucleic acid-binding protein|nr:hypothetical protein [Candidatus Methylacidiphilales bacterium]
MRGIADTGFLVAFLNRKDRFHPWALEIVREAEVPLLTCEPVLAEAAYHVRSSSHILALLDSGLIELRFDLAAALPRVKLLPRAMPTAIPTWPISASFA